MHPKVTFARQALTAGGCGYVLKHSAGEELLNAINDAINGGVYVAKLMARAVKQALEVLSTSSHSAIDVLTRRPREVLQLLAEGRHAKEIAATLNVSPQDRGISQIPDHRNARSSHGRRIGLLRGQTGIVG